tara:strand:+ start:409 stop:687 length:279 start_codon:yes stop_codon:yes gene_type:complete
MKDKLSKIEHYWSDENDRWIYVGYDKDGDVNGINWCQGDDYEVFKEFYWEPNLEFTKFYFEMEVQFGNLYELDLEFLNKVIWLYHEFNIDQK